MQPPLLLVLGGLSENSVWFCVTVEQMLMAHLERSLSFQVAAEFLKLPRTFLPDSPVV